MLKFISLVVCFFILYGCSNDGSHQKNKERLKEVYGECDNPFEPISRRKYKECKAKERAGGETLFDLGDDFSKLLGNNNANVIYQNNVNPYLWNAALDVIDIYPLKIADNQGGYIETDWIYERDESNKRCLIKVRVLSSELVSNGVSTKFLCQDQNKSSDWVNTQEDFSEEEKRITLKILNTASSLTNSL
tara:strand:- start:713 stop:1282 length:570 start_codon:yes stop_codon:yes gene_type:complete